MTNGPRSKYWVWTLNHPTPEEKANLDGLVGAGSVSYLCYGEEVGQAGTPHFQGYLEISTRVRLTGLKAFPGLARAHFEKRAGTQAQAKDYCAKDGAFHYFGELAAVSQGMSYFIGG